MKNACLFLALAGLPSPPVSVIHRYESTILKRQSQKQRQKQINFIMTVASLSKKHEKLYYDCSIIIHGRIVKYCYEISL